MSSLPDLAEYAAYETRTEITLEGVNFPGLVGQYFRREDGDRVETVGVYRFDGHEVFMAWGYADQAHCSFTAYRRKSGWTVPQPGCPSVLEVDDALGSLVNEASSEQPTSQAQTIQV